jgi:zinc transport system permease protein
VSEFFDALLRYSFLQHALLAGLLASIVCGVMGTYVVVRRITFISGGIAHCVLGGMGIAYYLRNALGWNVHPMHGAVLAALIAALVIGLISLRGGQHEDTVIGAVWAVGMAVGVIFISRTPGYNVDLMSYLFGNILMVTGANLWLMVALDAIILAVVIVFYKEFMAVCFDAEFSRLRGIRVDAYYLLLLCLTALTVVILVQVVGLILVIALLTIPAAIAGRFTRALWQMMIVAALLGTAFTTGGLVVSYRPGLPSGATIICLAGAAYLVVLSLRWVFTRLRRSRRANAAPAEPPAA